MLWQQHLINRMPSRVLEGHSPYQKLYGTKPMLTHLRVLGCLCFAKVLFKTDKMAPRSKESVHMGYSETQKGYILLDLTSHNFFVSRDVIFKETVFPFTYVGSQQHVGPFVTNLDSQFWNNVETFGQTTDK